MEENKDQNSCCSGENETDTSSCCSPQKKKRGIIGKVIFFAIISFALVIISYKVFVSPDSKVNAGKDTISCSQDTSKTGNAPCCSKNLNAIQTLDLSKTGNAPCCHKKAKK